MIDNNFEVNRSDKKEEEKENEKNIIYSSISTMEHDEGQERSFYFDFRSNIYGVGSNIYCQLGLTLDKKNITKFTPIFPKDFAYSKIAKVATGKNHTLFLTSNNKVFVCGDNTYDQLGLGNNGFHQTIDSPMVELNFGNEEIIDIATKALVSFFVSSSGSVYGCGNNEFFQLGLGHTKKCSEPIRITGELLGHRIKSVSCGYNHTIFLSEEGIAFGSGSNEDGQLGCPPRVSFLREPSYLPVNDCHSIKRVECGGYHTAFITNEDNVIMSGNNQHGQLGLGHYYNIYNFSPIRNQEYEMIKVKAISCGRRHTVFVTLDGQVYGFGENLYGQLGIGNKMGNCCLPQLIQFSLNLSIKNIYCGFNFSYFLTSDNQILGCGSNTKNKMGLVVDNDKNAGDKVTIPRFVDLSKVRFCLPEEKLVISCGYFHNILFIIPPNHFLYLKHAKNHFIDLDIVL
ncbi:hypothetical protein ABK040_008054 [Willaertia magna]